MARLDLDLVMVAVNGMYSQLKYYFRIEDGFSLSENTDDTRNVDDSSEV